MKLTRAQRMVQDQIVSRGITDAIVLRAMSVVPRHKFLQIENDGRSYNDSPVSIGFGQKNKFFISLAAILQGDLFNSNLSRYFSEFIICLSLIFS